MLLADCEVIFDIGGEVRDATDICLVSRAFGIGNIGGGLFSWIVGTTCATLVSPGDCGPETVKAIKVRFCILESESMGILQCEWSSVKKDKDGTCSSWRDKGSSDAYC
jgi:hypothetical protein